MKIIKALACFFILMSVGAIISYGQVQQSQWINQFIKTFEYTESQFKFYNIKCNSTVKGDISDKELKDICTNIINNLCEEDTNINWAQKSNLKDNKQIYGNAENKSMNISVIGMKKSNKESYIIVDILENKVYKNIGCTYKRLKSTLQRYTNDIEIYTCISGEYTKRLQNKKYNDILNEILYNMNANQIDRIDNENFLSITAHSNLINENNLKYKDKVMNLNIGIRYSEDEDKTFIYIATPIIKIDY